MKYFLIGIIALVLIGCDGASNKKSINACVELGVEKVVAKRECKDFEGLEKSIRQMTNKENDRTDNLFQQAELINKKFERYTKAKFKFHADLEINLNENKLFTSRKVTSKPFFSRNAVLKDAETSPYIYIKERKWRINEENYEFLSPSFSGKYQLRNDKTQGKLFTQFLNECSKTKYCKFSIIGTVDAFMPKIDESSSNDDWEGWVDVEDFTFNKFIITNPKREKVEEFVLEKVYEEYKNDYRLDDGFIRRAIFGYIYKS
jgi:hypothetical protein